MRAARRKGAQTFPLLSPPCMHAAELRGHWLPNPPQLLYVLTPPPHPFCPFLTPLHSHPPNPGQKKTPIMSGFEVAGIVLGSIPLLISALEHYDSGLSTIQRWRKHHRELQSLVRNLQTEEVKLQNICEKLLVGAVPASEIEAMIDEPRGALWRRETVQAKIQARLWKSYPVFQDTVISILEAIEEIRIDIEPLEDGHVSVLRRGAFTLRHSRHATLLLDIRCGVTNLENLTDRNMELEPERRVRSQAKLFPILRDLSSSFYRALRASFACACTHHVGLGLETRVVTHIAPMDNRAEISKDFAFQLTISYQSITSNNGANRTAGLSWQEIVIKSIPTSPPPLAIMPPRPASVTEDNRKKKKKKIVSFGPSPSTISMSSTGTGTGTATLARPAQQSLELHNLVPALTAGIAGSVTFSGVGVALDLCAKLCQPRQQAPTNDPYGTLIDQLAESARKYSIYPYPAAVDNSHSWSVVSLREILEHKTRFPPLSYQARLQLAVVISSSVLQLYGTPWLPSIITSRHIFFLRKNIPPHPDMYRRPLLLRHLPEAQDQPPLLDPTSTIAKARNLTLLSLGCVLVEVILGRTLDSAGCLPGREGAGVDLMSDFVAAQSLMGEVRLKSSNYGTAVARCIDGDLHKRDCGLEDGDLCHQVYSGVVALLEKDLENLW